MIPSRNYLFIYISTPSLSALFFFHRIITNYFVVSLAMADMLGNEHDDILFN